MTVVGATTDSSILELGAPRDFEVKEIKATGASQISSDESVPTIEKYWLWYSRKFQGVDGKAPPPMNSALHSLISSVLAFTGILLVAITDHFLLSRDFQADNTDVAMLTGAQAATAVLLYEAYQAPLSQPRNVLGSYTVCSIVGVSVRLVAGNAIGIQRWITGALAVAIAIAAMNATKTVHPPAGACALIAVIGGDKITNMGYGYVLTSMGAAIIMIAVALLGNNLVFNRQYPQYWS